MPASLRALKNANPRLKHFNIDIPTTISIGRRIFCPATWNDQNVTLYITFDLAMPMPQREFYLTPVAEFIDKMPKEIMEKVKLSWNEDMEGKAHLYDVKKYLIVIRYVTVFLISATISVLPCLHVTTIQSFGAMSKDINNEGVNRETSFVFLQLVNALKSFQAHGIEDVSKSLNDVILCREDIYYRLYLLQELVFFA